MKYVAVICALLSTFSALAQPVQAIVCQKDQRMEKGPLKELFLTPADNGYLLQSQFIPSLNSTDIVLENWAEQLTCHIDAKANLAFCKNPTGLIVAQIKERREVFYDSLEEDAKKKTTKNIDISVYENGVQTKSISFAASHCQMFNSEA